MNPIITFEVLPTANSFYANKVYKLAVEGDDDKFYVVKRMADGTWEWLEFGGLAPPSFVESITDTASINLTMTGTALSAAAIFGTTATTVAVGNHAHAGVYQPLDDELTDIAGLADPNADRILFWDDSASAITYLTVGTGLTITNTTIDAAEPTGGVFGLAWTLDEGGVPGTNTKQYYSVPFAALITGYTLLSDQSGDIVIDVWKDSYANHPPTDADSITAGFEPELVAATKDQDLDVAATGWTDLTVDANDVIVIKVDSAASLQVVTFVLILERT